MIPHLAVTTMRLEAIALFGADRDFRVLDHVTLAVRAGEMVALGGARGAGKSSLLAIAAGVLRPHAGAVCLGERDLTVLQRSSLPYVRRNIGYLPTEAPLLPDETVLENVRLALAARGTSSAQADAGARATLDALALTSLARRRVQTLSFPERRLTAIARALAGPAPLLVLDEPSAGLDAGDRDRVAAALEDAAAAGAAVLCATSDDGFADELAERGARRLTLVQGCLAAVAPFSVIPGGGWLSRPRATERSSGEAQPADASPAERRLRADGGGWT